MTTQAPAHDHDLAPVKFSRLTRRGVLLGLSASQLAVTGIAAVILVITLFAGGGGSLIYVAPILLACAALAFVSVGGRKAIQWLPVATSWTWRSSGARASVRWASTWCAGSWSVSRQALSHRSGCATIV